MKNILFLLIIAFGFECSFSQIPSSIDSADWKIGAQAYTFKKFTFDETLQKISSLGLNYVEAFPNQQIQEGIEGKMHYNMNAEKRQIVKLLLNKYNVQLLAYGVVSGESEEEWKNIFEFAKDMGIQIINSEPKPQFLDLINQMAGEYDITVALHNHPVYSKNNLYWSPEIVLNKIKNRENLKACADVGHWVRSGLDPIESLKKLEGNIASLHFKDLNVKGRDGHDVPWGTGISNIRGMLQELKRQEFKGIFSIEYEYNWENSLPEVEKSLEFFRKQIKCL